MLISLFAPFEKSEVTECLEISWGDLVANLSHPHPKDTPKEKLPMWSPASFAHSPDEDPTKGMRQTANVVGVSLLVFDVDVDPVPTLDDMASALWGTWFAHSTSSSTLLVPRWRLLLLMSRPMTVREHAAAWLGVTKRLPFPVGPASKDSSRAWFAPRCGDDGSFQVSGGNFAATV